MNKILIPFLFLILLLSCTKEVIIEPADLTNNPLQSEMDVRVDAIYQKYKSELNTIGVSIGVMRKYEADFYGYGETRKGSGIIPDKNTFYEIGSITKVFTAIATVNMLLNDGKNIDEPIKSYLPSDLPTLNRNGIELTFKHLLTHTSGLPNMPGNLDLAFYTNIAKGWENYDNDKLYTSLKNVRLKSDPFTRFSYSNTGMGVLGVILERKYKKDYGEVMQTEILDRLIDNTSAYYDRTNMNNWATGYEFGKETDYWKSLNALDGAGVLKSTALAMIKFASWNIYGYHDYGHLADAIDLCQNVAYDVTTEFPNGSLKGGLGWFIYNHKDLPGNEFLYHNGGTGGFNSEFFINKEQESALIIFFNNTGNTSGRDNFVRDLLELIAK